MPVLSNAIWIMPTENRANGRESAVILYRCGSSQGKPARTVAADISEADFTSLTADFLLAEIAVFRTASARKQRNANRNLKKCLDAPQIAIVEAFDGDWDAARVEQLLL